VTNLGLVLLLLLHLLLWLLLLFLFVLVEHEFECRKYFTVRTLTIEYRVHGGVAGEGRTKSNRRATCNGRLTR
jgi:hypothetical protein